MAEASSRRSVVLRSHSPRRRFHSSNSSQSSTTATTTAVASSAFASSSSTFMSQSTTFLQRSASPTRVNLRGSSAAVPSVRFSLEFDRSISPNRSIAVSPNRITVSSPAMLSQKRTCMCSPTTHPGSFRCSLHKNQNIQRQLVSYPSNRLNARRSAMTNSLVRIGTVEGDLVKRALAALIRPSSHQQRRRGSFKPRPSRLSVMTKAEDM